MSILFHEKSVDITVKTSASLVTCRWEDRAGITELGWGWGWAEAGRFLFYLEAAYATNRDFHCQGKAEAQRGA